MYKLLARVGIARKLALLTALGALAALILVVLSLFAQRTTLMGEKETTTRLLVDTAMSTVQHYHDLAKDGALSDEQARQQALASLQALRFDGGGYFWVNDMQLQMLMHPIRPDLDGTSVRDFADPNGVYLYREMVNTVRDHGRGFVPYVWQEPGFPEPLEKVSYVEGFAPWGWVVGTGIYVDDVQAQFAGSLKTAAIHLAILLALLLGASWVLARSITRPMQQALQVAEAVAAGELDHRIDAEGSDEAAQLLAALKRMQARLQEFVQAQDEIARHHDAGDLDHRMEPARFPGAYGHMAAQVNGLVDSHVGLLAEVNDLIGDYARGDLSRDFPRLPGKKARITEAMDAVKENLQATTSEIGRLVDAAVAGDFGQRGDADQFEFAYREMIGNLNTLMASAERGLDEVGGVLNAVSEGDLGKRADEALPGRFGRLAADANRTTEKLTQIVGQIREGSDAINAAAREIAEGNSDLSRRTEQQAASLEETASSMEELTSTVQHNADNARQANELARGAAGIAGQGGEVVHRVVRTMEEINEASHRIVDIIAVIDGIAFQTNILALNAAVEAARAGEQGRGFAVVASEVRSLAQRSAAAAKEIKGLIDDSVARVGTGTELVGEAGRTMDEIVESVNRVAGIIADISAASAEQSAGIEQVSQAVVQMDEGTQQNAALVEQASAAARSLEQQAGTLVQTVAVFRAEGAGAATADHAAWQAA